MTSPWCGRRAAPTSCGTSANGRTLRGDETLWRCINARRVRDSNVARDRTTFLQLLGRHIAEADVTDESDVPWFVFNQKHGSVESRLDSPT